MTNTERIASEIVQRFATLKHGSLSVYGDIFGGRIDNNHTVTGAHALGPSRVVIEFDERETLEVWIRKAPLSRRQNSRSGQPVESVGSGSTTADHTLRSTVTSLNTSVRMTT